MFLETLKLNFSILAYWPGQNILHSDQNRNSEEGINQLLQSSSARLGPVKKLLSQGFLVFFKGFDNFPDRKEEVKDYFGRSADGMYQCKACGKKEKQDSVLANKERRIFF